MTLSYLGISFALEVFTQSYSVESSFNQSSHTLSTMTSLSARILIRATNRALEIPTGLFIDNEFVPSVDSASEPIQYDHSSPSGYLIRIYNSINRVQDN